MVFIQISKVDKLTKVSNSFTDILIILYINILKINFFYLNILLSKLKNLDNIMLNVVYLVSKFVQNSILNNLKS